MKMLSWSWGGRCGHVGGIVEAQQIENHNCTKGPGGDTNLRRNHATSATVIPAAAKSMGDFGVGSNWPWCGTSFATVRLTWTSPDPCLSG